MKFKFGLLLVFLSIILFSCKSSSCCADCNRLNETQLRQYLNSLFKNDAFLVEKSANRINRRLKKDSLIVESYRFNDKGFVEYYNFYNFDFDKNSILGIKWDEKSCSTKLGGESMFIAELSNKTKSDTIGLRIYSPQIINHTTMLYCYTDTDTLSTDLLKSPIRDLLLPLNDFDGIDTTFIEVIIREDCSNKILSKTVHPIPI